MTFTLETLADTEQFANQLASKIPSTPFTITLDGDLGAGKTTWTRFFGKALGVKRTINSPTFTIMKSYKMGNGETLYHLDAYRLEGAHQDLGFEECFDSGLCVVEWSEYIAEQIPEDHLSISLERTGETSRNVVVKATGEQSAKVLEGWDNE